MKVTKKYYGLIFLLPLWIALFWGIKPFSEFFTFDVLNLKEGLRLSDAICFFIYEVPKVMLLLVLIVFISGFLRSYFSAEKTRKWLEGKSHFTGNILASMLGIVTPFCSCSAIPLFLGFIESGIPVGVTFSFLIAAPMINEIAIGLLFSMFGWKVTLIYISTGLVIAIISGWIIGVLKLEKWVQSWVFEVKANQTDLDDQKITLEYRIQFALNSVKDIIRRIWIYIAIGIGIGAIAHGYVPEDYLAGIMGKSAWYSVPVSILIGIPLYSNAAGIIPVVSVLLEKGASLGTALAFMMSVIGLSLPEIIILKKVLKMPMILAFTGIVGFGIMIVGYLFNFIFS